MLNKDSLFYTTPAFVSGILLLNLRPMVDKLFVTQYFSSPEIVLIGTVNLITFIPECIVLSCSYAIQSLSSRVEDESSIYHYLIVGFLTAIFALTPILGLLALFPEYFLHLISSNAPTSAHCIDFFRLRLLGCLLQCLIFCLRGFYAAHRNNRIFFTVIASTLTLHCMLAHLLLSGSSWMQPLGIVGLGLSYALSMAVGLCIYIEQLYRNCRILLPTLPTMGRYFKLWRVSLPLTLHGIVDHIGTTLIFTTTGQFFGLLPLASLHLVSSIQGISPGAGFGLTALTEVSKSRVKDPDLANQVGWRIMIIGSCFLGSIGVGLSLFAPSILSLAAPSNIPLQMTTLAPLQIMLCTLCLHVGCQTILKILQAVDHTVASVCLNLGFIYGFRIPMLFIMGSTAGASIVTVSLIIAMEKFLKLSAMIIYWVTVACPAKKVRQITASQPG